MLAMSFPKKKYFTTFKINTFCALFMKFHDTKIPGVLSIELECFKDKRGYFMETFRSTELSTRIGKAFHVAQSNESFSEGSLEQGVLRGIHAEPWDKYVRVPWGAVMTVVVDMRTNSKTFGKFEAFFLGRGIPKALYIPMGVAHGFYAIEPTVYTYMVNKPYEPGNYPGIRWDDPDLAIPWPNTNPILTPKDEALPTLRELYPDVYKGTEKLK